MYSGPSIHKYIFTLEISRKTSKLAITSANTPVSFYHRRDEQCFQILAAQAWAKKHLF
jgi:hypothetical protein